MKFRFEDFLKNIIPGMILLLGILIFLTGGQPRFSRWESALQVDLKDFSEIIVLLFLVISFLVGYINDGLSSWLEYYCIYAVLGTPALRLLRGKGKRISLVICNDVIKHLKTTQSLSDDDVNIARGSWCYYKSFRISRSRANTLFKYANNLKDSNPQAGIGEKIRDYYYAYIFSRNLFFSALFSSFLFIITCYSSMSWKVLITLILVVVFLGIRRRDKSYYYTRNILLACKY